MKKILFGSIFLLSSSVLADPYKSEFVEVSIQVQEGEETFKLVCKPKVPVGQLPEKWVSSCNDIGKNILALAIENGVEVELVDKVFGMAGDSVQEVSSDLPDNIVPKKIISREFGG